MTAVTTVTTILQNIQFSALVLTIINSIYPTLTRNVLLY